MSEEEILEKIENQRFVKRPLSWVCAFGNYFYKISRKSDVVREDYEDVDSEIVYEFKALSFLSTNTKFVKAPTKIIKGCLVMPFIEGVDFYRYLRSENKEVEEILSRGIEVCAEIHRIPSEELSYPNVDYAKYGGIKLMIDQEKLGQEKYVIVCTGYEVRNLIVDIQRKVWFFDPHELQLGFKEDDISRYILSILMLNWGRRGSVKMYGKFRLDKLIKGYEAAAKNKINMKMLKVMMSYNVAMRKYYAKREIQKMSLLRRQVAWIYFNVYFFQIKLWRRRYGI